MHYNQISSSEEGERWIKSFWSVDSLGDAAPIQEKIIPDGYPEIIFHYGDAYQANISGLWESQHKFLIAGQIRNHFFLKNTGTIGMIGIKLQPTTLYELFGLDMSELTNKALPFEHLLPNNSGSLIEMLTIKESLEEKKTRIESYFKKIAGNLTLTQNKARPAIDLIIERNGDINISHIAESLGLSERSLERLFRKSVGLSPKFYSRIIRLGKVFKLLEADQKEWTAIAHLCGYYDQAHFIKNFQEFAGEDPTKYIIENPNMANLFLR